MPTNTPELNTDPYTFTRDGVDHTLPSFGSLKAGQIRRVRHLDEASQMFTLLEQVADADTLAVIDDMSIPEVTEFFLDWQRTAGADLPS